MFNDIMERKVGVSGAKNMYAIKWIKLEKVENLTIMAEHEQ